MSAGSDPGPGSDPDDGDGADDGAGWPDVAAAYRQVADDYAATFDDELDAKPFDRDLLGRFADDAGRGSVVADLGCGPAQIGAFLAARGPAVVGLDLSLPMLERARRRHPDVAVAAGDLCRLPLADRTLDGAVCFYALIHLRRRQLGVALGELARVLRPGAPLLVAVHGGTGELRRDSFLGHPVPVAATLFGLDELAARLEEAGLAVVERHARDPYPAEAPTTRLYLWARRR